MASTLSVRSVTDSSVTLVWTKADERNFQSYHLYKGEGNIVDTTDELVDTLIFIVDTVYTVHKLQADKEYSFRIVTAGKSGANSVSNSIETRTTVNLSKVALKLNAPDTSEITDHSVTLRWDRKWDWSDSVYYHVYMDTVNQVDSLDSLVASVFGERTITLSKLSRNKEYHFRVFLENKDSSTAGSNSVKVVTKSGEPQSVTIVDTLKVTDKSVSLRFSKSTDSDFAYYCLWKDTETGIDSLKTVDTISSHATVVSDINDTVVSAENLSPETKYYFSLYVVDTAGLFTASKIYSVTTKDTLYNQFTVSSSAATDTTLQLSWDVFDRKDFTQYEIYWDTLPDADTNSVLLGTVTDQTKNSFPVKGIKAYQQKFFRVYVRGTSGIEMKSNVVTNFNSIMESLPVSEGKVPLIWRSAGSLAAFDRVKLYRSADPIVSDKLIPLKEFESAGISNYIDSSAVPGDHYYRIYYYTDGVRTGESNLISVSVPMEQQSE